MSELLQRFMHITYYYKTYQPLKCTHALQVGDMRRVAAVCIAMAVRQFRKENDLIYSSGDTSRFGSGTHEVSEAEMCMCVHLTLYVAMGWKIMELHD